MKNKNLKSRNLFAGRAGKYALLIGLGAFPFMHVAANPALAEYQAVQQQTGVITGRVIDDNGEVVIGANVVIKGTTKAVMTDLDGNYSINAKEGETLVFSFLGLQTKSVKVGDKKVINVTLETDAVLLDEVVAVGYGTMKRSDLTGAVVSIDSEAIEQMAPTSIDQVLQGRAAGVLMTQDSGLPGGGASIQIRGLNSINNTNEPIYIIDGVTISGETGTTTDNALSSINPSDIESMEILKDASATAIYGAQGANGVIIITTKQGKEGRPRVNVEAQYGIQYLVKELDVANLREFAYHRNDIYEAGGIDYASSWAANPALLGEGTNWQRAIFTPAAMQNYNLSMSGGVKGTTYKLSANYLNQDGVGVGSSFDRLTMTVGINSEMNKWLKVGANATIGNTRQVSTLAGWSLIHNAVRQSPHVPITNLDGSYAAPGEEDWENTLSNPLAVGEMSDRSNRKLSVRGNVFATLNLFKWMNFRTEFAANINSDESRIFQPEYYFNDWSQRAQADRQETINNSYNWTWRNQLNIKFHPTKHQNLNLMLGHEMNETTTNRLNGKRTGGNATLPNLSAGDANYAENTGYTTRRAFLSFFGRLNYSLLDRYMLTATLRYDGSSRFAEGHRWGMFPSVSLAWRINKEKFLKNVDWISNLKLRAGYGHVGNSNVVDFAYDYMLKNITTIWGTGHILSRIPNEDITWETTKSVNVGLDLAMFNNRVEFIADLYYKRTDDLLLILSLPGITGTNGTTNITTQAPWNNVGSMENKGIELTLNTVNISKPDFTWKSSFVFTLNRNKVLDLNTATAQIDKTYDAGGHSYVVTRTAEGRPIGQFYGYKVIGRINSAYDLYDANGKMKIAIPEGLTVDRENGVWVGDLIFEDINKDGVINEEDQTYIGNPLPKFTGGIGNTFSYKGFDLNIYFTYSYGNDVMNWLNFQIDDPNERVYNITKRAAVDYAKLELYDPNASADNIYNVYVASGADRMYRLAPNDPNENNRVSNRIIEDGSYLRLQSVSLSYNFPKRWVRKLRINSLKAYCNMKNLFTITKYSGYDPEVGMASDQYSNYNKSALLNGFDPGRYPSPRSFTFGINVGF